MNFRNLQIFVEVVRHGGFTPAAAAVAATQSTVSKSVRQLEDEAGLPLLERIGHTVALTAAGEVVFRRAQKLLADRSDLLEELAGVRQLERGTLRLGLPPVGSGTMFAPLFALYRQRFPGVDIRLTEYGGDRVEAALRSGEIDLAVVLLPTSDEFDLRPIRQEPLVAALPAAHPIARERETSLQGLHDVPFILFQEGYALHRILLNRCRELGITPRIAAQTGQIDFMVKLVRAGLGVAFLPRVLAEELGTEGVKIVTLVDPSLHWNTGYAWRRASLSIAGKAWLDLAGNHDNPA